MNVCIYRFLNVDSFAFFRGNGEYFLIHVPEILLNVKIEAERSLSTDLYPTCRQPSATRLHFG